MPRIPLGSTAELALPQPLTPSEATRVRRIFALQAKGDLNEAIRDTDQLDNRLLLGPILADRYLGGWMHPTLAELDDWLARFGDQPDATAIRALRSRLAPEAAAALAPPSSHATAHPTGHPTAHPHSLAPAGPDAARALFVHNHDAAAVAAATPLLSRPAAVPGSADALFAGGLAAWRLGDAAAAMVFFEAAYRTAPLVAQRAAGAYWAARAAQRQADRSGATVWLRRAAAEHHTFYGRIAARALGPASACQPDPTLGIADIDALATMPAGRRAFALVQVGEPRRAAAELRVLWADAGGNPDLAAPLALVARAIGLPELTAELRTVAFPAREGPLPPELHPAGGFVVDPSLVYGLVRHESDFHAAAVSHAGARGLMQIKPATARSVSGARSLAGLPVGQLQEPAVNLAVGQRYVLELADDDAIDGDLIRLLAGYAQGPFELRRWADRVNAPGDPLLFLEAMPNPATRGFVEDVLAWSWHYAAVLKLPAASLDALAAGRYPRLVRAGQPPIAAAAACGMLAATR